MYHLFKTRAIPQHSVQLTVPSHRWSFFFLYKSERERESKEGNGEWVWGGGGGGGACMHAKLFILLVSVTSYWLSFGCLCKARQQADPSSPGFPGMSPPVDTLQWNRECPTFPRQAYIHLCLSVSRNGICHLACILHPLHAASKQKWKERFPMLRVGDKRVLVERVVEERRQGLAEEDIRHHQPPS